MGLKLQIITLFFYFFYGFLFSFLLTLLYNWIETKKKWIQYSSTFLFVLVMTLFYFSILKKINYGIIHPYSFLSLFVGYAIEHLLHLHFLTFLSIVKKKET